MDQAREPEAAEGEASTPVRRLVKWWGNPRFLVRFHAAATLLFLAQIPVALLTGLQKSVPYLVFLSLWALVASHATAWEAARLEIKQDEIEG